MLCKKTILKPNFIVSESGYLSSAQPRPSSVSNSNSARPTVTTPQENTAASGSVSYNERPSTIPASSRPSSTSNSQRPANSYTSESQYPASATPTIDQYPQHKYPDGDKYSTMSGNDDRYASKPTTLHVGNAHPYDDSFPTNRPSYSNEAATSADQQHPPNDIHTYSSTTKDKFNFYNDMGPIYQYPMLYEHNYPRPNDNRNYPNVYAQNVPTVNVNYYRPTLPAAPTAPTSVGGSFGTYSPSNTYGARPAEAMPTYATAGTKPSNGLSVNGQGMGYDNRPTNGKPGNANNYFYYETSGGGDNDATVTSGDGKIGAGASGYSNNNGSYSDGKDRRPEENGYATNHMKPIETYFNPDDYYFAPMQRK